MPLDVSALSSGLAECFAHPAADAAGCAGQWADAAQAYASGIVPPSTTVNAAAEALEGALAGAFASPAAIPVMESAFAAFAVSIASGMAPLFTGAPPSGPVGFAGQFAGPAPETHGEAAGAIASLIDTWMKSGTATLVALPNTVTSWS
jgi:hypothetical protein